MYTTTIAPPNAFVPRESMLLVAALQLEEDTLLMDTVISLAVVGPALQMLSPTTQKLNAYAPTYTMTIEPPYEFMPRPS
jgi:hypothetical protein